MASMQHLLQCYKQLEDLRLKLNEPIVPLTNDAILAISTQLQPLYKKLLITNLDEALSRQLENGLWNDCFKTPLTRFGRTDKNLFHLMIEAGVAFFLGLVQDIGIHFDITFIINTTPSNKLFCTKTSSSPLVSPRKTSVYYILQNSLLHVGDLLRYRGSYPEALKMYEKSAAVCPSNGFPFYQMGLTQALVTSSEDYTMMNNFLSSFYFFARGLAVANPHLQANAFDTLANKIKSTPANGNKYHDFIRQYLLNVASTLGKDEQLQAGSYNMVPMLSPLVTNQQIKPSILFQMIIIALWAQWRNANGSRYSADEFTLEIIAGIINSILIATIGLFGTGDIQDYNSSRVNNGSNSSIVDKRFLFIPQLKLLVDWLLRLQQNEKTVKQLSYLRDKAHTGTLVKFLNQIKTYNQQADEDLNNNFILPEEKRLIGFLPLDYSAIRVSGGSLLDENNPKTHKIRINRLIQAAIKLSEANSSGLNFIGYDGMYFMETKSSPTMGHNGQMPSRRNVALTSIFRSNGQSDELSPSPTLSMPLSLGSANGNNNPSDPFRSIWTPDSTKSSTADSAWN